MKKLIVILILILAVQLTFAQVISAKDLKKLAKSGDVIIVSTRPIADYSAKHIKGAIHVDHKALYKEDGVSSMLKSADEIAAVLGEQGITADSKIVIYDTGSNKTAGRMYWILRYMGATDVNILDGHLKGWGKIRGSVTKNATTVETATFTPNVNSAFYADMAYVKANKDNIVLLDVRSAEEFAGENEDTNLSRFGHIPGAVNLEYKAVLNDDGTIKSKDEILAIMTAAGVTGDKEVVLYCATSVRAGIVFLALKDILDYQNVKVYDGAYYEWESVTDNPIE